MAILGRFKDIMSSNINALLDKAENPEKMVDQYLRNAKKDLAEVRKETAGVMAEEKRAQNEVNETQSEVNKFANLTKEALKAGNREHAGTFLKKQKELESLLTDQQSIAQAAKTNADQMRELHNKLVSDISNMENRKNILKGKASATRARETVNRMGASSAKHNATSGKMGDMENKINERFNRAMSESELLEGTKDEAEDLMSQYAGGKHSNVDDELDALSRELGLMPDEELESELDALEEELDN